MTFKIIDTFIFICIIQLQHVCSRHSRATQQQRLLSSSLTGLPVSSLSRIPADALKSIDKFTGTWIPADELGRINMFTGEQLKAYLSPATKTMRAAAEQWLIENVHSLTYSDLNQLNLRFVKSPDQTSLIHSQQLIDAVYAETKRRLECFLFLSDSDFESFVEDYRMVAGEETETCRRYKAMYNVALLRGLRTSLRPTQTIKNVTLVNLLTAVSFRSTNHNERLADSLYDFANHFLHHNGVSTKMLVDMYIEIFNGGHIRQNQKLLLLFTDLLNGRISSHHTDSLYISGAIRLLEVFVWHAANVDTDFMQRVTASTQRMITADIEHRTRGGYDGTHYFRHGEKVLDYDGAPYLKHKEVLDSLGISFTIDVPDTVERLRVCDVYFNENRLSAFHFGNKSQLMQIVMINHGYHHLNYDNFAKYFGVAVYGWDRHILHEDFEIIALGGQWIYNTPGPDGRQRYNVVDIRPIGIPYLKRFIVDENVKVLNSEMCGEDYADAKKKVYWLKKGIDACRQAIVSLKP